MKSKRNIRISKWFDDNILLCLSGFLLAFIPLWPKIPLFSPIEQYIVRVRLEDVFIFITGIIWLVQAYRQKITWRSKYFVLVLAYAIIGMLSLLSALFVIQTVPLQTLHVGKSALHYFRYLEYFSLFFILYSSVKSKKDVQKLLFVVALTVIAIAIYGYGQKYWYWPVYSTMNREFSKGVRLYLTEFARVQSTFAGHYDLGAYLVVFLPVIFGQFLITKKKLVKSVYLLSFILGLWLLMISASRAPFASYLLGISIALLLFMLIQKGIKQKFFFSIKYGILVYVLTGGLFLLYGQDMYSRFLQVLEGYPQFNQTYHYLNGKRKEGLDVLLLTLLGQDAKDKIKPQVPEGAVGIEDTETGNALTPTDQVPVTQKPKDVYVDVPDVVAVATKSASGSTTIIYEKKERVFSDCAINKGLSWCIRVETLWPQAIRALKLNPFLGKGYATLNKEGKYHFTEADSTDNNLLRTLGETGALGFLSFYGVIALAIYKSIKGFFSNDQLKQALSIGLIGSSAGLLFNAIYIDVFAASKVALTYWALVGLTMAYLNQNQKVKNKKPKKSSV